MLTHADDAFLDEHELVKGSMLLVDGERSDAIYAAMGPGAEVSGGCAANTSVGVVSFGASAAFIGKVRDDQLGRIYAHDLRAAGVAFEVAPAPVDDPDPTGRCLILVTPDGERTMNTFLGASVGFKPSDLDAFMIESAKIVYLEGYLFDRDEAKAAFREAARLAKSSGAKVALSLSDAFCVNRHREDFRKLVREDAHIVFANEKEITALYEVNSFEEAVSEVHRDCELAVLTRSEHGSVIVAPNEVIAVEAAPVARVVDVTGAGDLYSSGFLYGLTQGLWLNACGMLGSLAASEIIGHLGARPERSLHGLAKAAGLLD